MALISILAVLADRDEILAWVQLWMAYFNPRGPCGPRLYEQGMNDREIGISILAVLADRDI